MTALKQHWVVPRWVRHFLRNWANEDIVEAKTRAQIDFARHFLGIEIGNSCSHGFLSADVLRQAVRRCNQGHEEWILLVDPVHLAIEAVDLSYQALPYIF